MHKRTSICKYIHTRHQAHIDTFTHASTIMHVHANTDTRCHVDEQACVRKHTCALTFSRDEIRTHANAWKQIRTHGHQNTHIFTQIQMCIQIWRYAYMHSHSQTIRHTWVHVSGLNIRQARTNTKTHSYSRRRTSGRMNKLTYATRIQKQASKRTCTRTGMRTFS
jgi:hypothetical protein